MPRRRSFALRSSFSLICGLAALHASTQSAPLYKRSDAPVEARIQDLLGRMTVVEKARQLDMYAGALMTEKQFDNTHAQPGTHVDQAKIAKELGSLGAGSIHDLYPQPALYNEIQGWVIAHNRLGIPALFIEEAVHGYSGLDATLFPCSINLASTWDAELAKSTAAAIASEARSCGVGYLLCPVLDVARDPRWGRIEEDFGEDPYLSGALGAAYVHGIQGDSLSTDHNCAAEPKHFAGHGAPEGGLNTAPVDAGEREVRSILLRSFQPAVEEAHAMGVMAAYHEIDGVPCAGNPWLLTTVLRNEWGFKGFVLSDLGAVQELYSRHHIAATPAEAVQKAIASGVDMQFYDFDHATYQNAIIDGVKSGKLPLSAVDRAVTGVLRVKFELGLFDHPYVDPGLQPTVSRSQGHLDLSLRSARESICLLRNEKGLLPLSKSLDRIAVIGPNAATARTGDYTPPHDSKYPSMLDAIKAEAPGTQVSYTDGSNIDAAVEAIKGCKVAILALGEREGLSGEGSDRSNLDLPDNQEQLLEAVAAAGVPVVLVLQNGRPLSIPWAAEHVPAILEAWYPGERGATAIAETLFGDNNPSGKLPISFPRTVGALPDFYNRSPSRDRDYVDGSSKPVFPFGFGLSYTSFSYGNLKASPTASGVEVTVTLSNTGSRAGEEVAQLYLRPNTASVTTPVRALKAFQRVRLEPGQTRTLSFQLGRKALEIWGAAKQWSVEPGAYTVWVGGSSLASLRGTFRIDPQTATELTKKGP